MTNCIAVGLGGFIGATLRYLIGLIPVCETTLFPVKTFFINIAGCIAIALVAMLASKGSISNPKLVLFLKTGICGGFTTFSTFALESTTLIKEGHPMVAPDKKTLKKSVKSMFFMVQTRCEVETIKY